MTKSRLEAFSDGVLAIAITLLTLDLPVPGSDQIHTYHGLWGALVHNWPSFAAYVISFTVIGIMWVNHHALIQRVAVVDRSLLFLNLLLLLFIAALPFSTRLFAEFLRTGGPDAHVAAAVYSANAFGCAIGFNSMWWWLVRDDRRLHVKLDPEVARSSTRRFSLGLFVYAATIGLSFVSAMLTLAAHAAVGIYYVVDQLPMGRSSDEEPVA